MMNQTMREQLRMLQKHAGKIGNNNSFMENWYNTLADIYLDELLKEVKTDKDGALMLSQLREQLDGLHQLGEEKQNLIFASIYLLGFETDEEVENFINEEPEYMQIVTKDFDDTYHDITSDAECLMDLFTHELKNRHIKTIFPPKMRKDIVDHIDFIATKYDDNLPQTLDEWIDRICETSEDIDLITKLVERTEIAYMVLRECLDDYLTDPVSKAYNSDYANAIINKAIHN